MANHDYVIANQGFPSFRSDLNNVLQAVVSNNSSASEPSTKYAYQMWYETDTNVWKMRNGANNAWIPLATFNQTNNTVNFTDSSATVAGISTSASATVMTLANGSVAINPAGFVSVGGAATQAGEIRFLEDTDNGTNYIALRAGTISSNLTLTLPTAAGTNGQIVSVDGSGNLSFVDNSGGTAWQAVKTANFTAVAGQGYFLNTTSGAKTVTLPSSPTLGDEIRLVDYAATFDTNPCTIARSGKNIQGVNSDLVISTERAAFGLVFVDNTQGWLLTEK